MWTWSMCWYYLLLHHSTQKTTTPNTADLTFPPFLLWMDTSLQLNRLIALKHSHTTTCLARKATFSRCRSLARRQVQYLWVAAAFYCLSLTKKISISGTLPVNPAALHITYTAIAVSPAGCHRDEPSGCHRETANKLGFLAMEAAPAGSSAAGMDGWIDGWRNM